jgi:hypothetical protein
MAVKANVRCMNRAGKNVQSHAVGYRNAAAGEVPDQGEERMGAHSPTTGCSFATTCAHPSSMQTLVCTATTK